MSRFPLLSISVSNFSTFYFYFYFFEVLENESWALGYYTEPHPRPTFYSWFWVYVCMLMWVKVHECELAVGGHRSFFRSCPPCVWEQDLLQGPGVDGYTGWLAGDLSICPYLPSSSFILFYKCLLPCVARCCGLNSAPSAWVPTLYWWRHLPSLHLYFLKLNTGSHLVILGGLALTL